MSTNPFSKYTKTIINLAKKNHISYLALFGSHARGEQKKDSDIDLLVKFNQPIDFFELYDVEEKLKNVFHKKVDLVTVEGLSKYIKPYIQPDLKVLYESI